MFEWIKKHKVVFTIMCLIVLIGIPFIINLLFKFNSNLCFLEAEWSAGDALGYYGTILSFVGTVVLGALALYQNHVIKEESDKRAAKIEELERIQNMPKFSVQKSSVGRYCENFSFCINNLSENIAYEINISNIRLQQGSYTVWKSEKEYFFIALEPKDMIFISLDSPMQITESNFNFVLDMNCKDKYDVKHKYSIVFTCAFPHTYIGNIDEIQETKK